MCRTRSDSGSGRREKERARVDGDPGGTPADGVGAPGGVKDVNLQQGKLSERRLKLQRGRKGVDEPFTGDGSFTGGNGGQRWRRRGNWGSSACVGVLRLQRGVQELGYEFK
jgi:hypothetical protein